MKKLICSIITGITILSLTACVPLNVAVPNNTVQTEVADSTSTDDVTEDNDSAEVEVEAVCDESADVEVEENQNEADSDASNVIYPVTITDQAGREVVIEKEPETLVSGYYISSSLLIALELDDKMVGIEAKADKRPIYKLAAKELIDLPSVGSAKEFDLEGCAALNPELVILPMKLKDTAATLEELGIKTILVNPENEELLVEMIDIVSTATNTVEKGEAIKNFINTNKDMLNAKLGDAEKANVYLAGNSSVLSTAGNKMYQCKMIELAGGNNVAADIEDKYWVDVDYEQILTWNPDYIIIAAEADYSVEDVLNDETLSECNAVANGNVYKFPSDAEAWDSPVPSGILGSVWLANVLHPDVISIEERDSIIEEFYESFYEFKYSEK